jgi:hypothetical protein
MGLNRQLFRQVFDGIRALVTGGIVAAAAGCVLAIGCGRSPVAPSKAAVPALDQTGLAVAAGLTPTDLAARGWDCGPTPIPNTIGCSQKDRPTPGNPPPADRPASFTALLFTDGGSFIGTVILIRSDLYQGQICESTGAPYILRTFVGYYECVHTAGH